MAWACGSILAYMFPYASISQRYVRQGGNRPVAESWAWCGCRTGEKPMPKLIAILSMTVALLLPPAAGAADLEANKKVVVEFYEAALNRMDFEAAAKHFGPRYIQHNPGAPDGIEGFRQFIAMRKEKTPKARSEIKRVFAEGDYVILH